MKKQILLGLGAGAVLVLIFGSIKFLQIRAAIAEGEGRQQPPQAVTSIEAKQEQWQLTRDAVGTVSAVQGATLSIEELGTVRSINFASGERVEKGRVLVELDTSVEEAELKAAEAKLALADVEAKRQRSLRERNANAQADLDTAVANLTSAQAEVERLKAVIGRKRVTAPFAGRTGIRMVNVGQTISAGTPVVSLQSSDPLYVDFSLPQRELGHLSASSAVELTVDAYPDQVFAAKLTAIEPKIDETTRNISLQATVANPEGLLSPGMFVHVTVIYPEDETVISIPASSINYAPYGDSVFVIEPAAAQEAPRGVRPQVVKTGRRRGEQIAILEGLRPGEEVVTSGTFKLRPGVQVIVNNTIAPGNSPAPSPADT
ncbi:MAG: efflux RND transporter periplasmic adaptor subunit [Bdellovibrionales bacterium]|nr:efflux RND transporter periplasmic adaptor subunit [Bdellovibrionales bacterium]